MLQIFIVSAMSIIVSVLVTGLVVRYSGMMGLISSPNHRSSHEDETPHGGGIGIVIAYLICLLCLYGIQIIDSAVFYSLAGGGAIIAGIGLYDDIKPAKARLRFIMQAIVVILGYWLVVYKSVDSINNIESYWNIATQLLVIFSMVWWLNLFNFMDGADAYAASESVLILVSAVLLIAIKSDALFTDFTDVQLLMILLVTSVLGFLFYNWPPAQIFMGDTGSTFLGYTLAIIALLSILKGELSVWVWLILSAGFLVDATVTLITRIVTGQRWYLAHHNHAYQKCARILMERNSLSRSGSHRVLTIFSVFITFCWLLPLAWISQEQPDWSIEIVLIAWLPLFAMVIYLDAGKEGKAEKK